MSALWAIYLMKTLSKCLHLCYKDQVLSELRSKWLDFYLYTVKEGATNYAINKCTQTLCCNGPDSLTVFPSSCLRFVCLCSLFIFSLNIYGVHHHLLIQRTYKCFFQWYTRALQALVIVTENIFILKTNQLNNKHPVLNLKHKLLFLHIWANRFLTAMILHACFGTAHCACYLQSPAKLQESLLGFNQHSL